MGAGHISGDGEGIEASVGALASISNNFSFKVSNQKFLGLWSKNFPLPCACDNQPYPYQSVGQDAVRTKGQNHVLRLCREMETGGVHDACSVDT